MCIQTPSATVWSSSKASKGVKAFLFTLFEVMASYTSATATFLYIYSGHFHLHAKDNPIYLLSHDA
jgi:hypothetical protein